MNNQTKYKLPDNIDNYPYVEFRFSKDGKLTFQGSNSWWGGINSGFTSSDGSSGNACKVKDLSKYIQRFKKNKIKSYKKEISDLQKAIKQIESYE